MAYSIGAVVTLKVTLNGKRLEHEFLGLEDGTATFSEDKAALARLVFSAPDDNLLDTQEGEALKLEWGWDERFESEFVWSGKVQTLEADFDSGFTQVVILAYGPSFELRDANNPEAVKGTRKDAAERLIRKYNLTPNVKLSSSSTATIYGLKDSQSAWETLRALARAENAFVLERGADTIYIGARETQDTLYTFYYGDAPGTLDATVSKFAPRWSRKKRLKKVTVISDSSKDGKRIEGIWDYAPVKLTTTKTDKRGRQRTSTIKDDDRTNELSLRATVKTKAEAEQIAKRIGTRGEGMSRTAELDAPMVPVRLGDVIAVDGDDLGRYAGKHIITEVQFTIAGSAAGEMRCSLERKG